MKIGVEFDKNVSRNSCRKRSFRAICSKAAYFPTWGRTRPCAWSA